MIISSSKNGTTVTAYQGDAMTLLAFDVEKSIADDTSFVGFSVKCTTANGYSYFLFNKLSFTPPAKVAGKYPDPPPVTSDKAPFQKFRWIHVAGNDRQPLNATYYGDYTYEVTPRFMHNGVLSPLDPTTTVSVTIPVAPFIHDKMDIGFARGFMVSQAYANRFGNDTTIRPDDHTLLFDINANSGLDPKGHPYTYKDQHVWMGFMARAKTMEFLQAVISDVTLSLDVFAYDLDEPEVCRMFLQLAREGRFRMILDDSKATPKISAYKTEFMKCIDATAKGDLVVRGHYGRLAHNKILIAKRSGIAERVLTGSTNFTSNGFYINANHVIIINDPAASQQYEEIFEHSFSAEGMKNFAKQPFAKGTTVLMGTGTPTATVSFSPHSKENADRILNALVKKINGVKGKKGSVLFSVMQLGGGGPVLKKLREIHKGQVFSYGITDSVKGVSLYKPASRRGLLINAKSVTTNLPPPFKEELHVREHRIHHKFVVLNFSGDDPVVFCGSSNLAGGGEKSNGDNLIAIYDPDIATAFAIEALRLVDHYHFRALVNEAQKKKNGKAKTEEEQPLVLKSDNRWVREYFDPKDMHCRDRELFGKP